MCGLSTSGTAMPQITAPQHCSWLNSCSSTRWEGSLARGGRSTPSVRMACCLSCDTQVCEVTEPITVTKLSLNVAQNERKLSKSRKQKPSLSYSWQRDLVESSTR